MGKITSGWNFSSSHGFSGSCGKTAVKSYMRGGHVKDNAKGLQKTALPLAPKSGSAPKASVCGDSSLRYQYARGGAIRPSDKERKDYNDSKASSEPVYPEVGTREKPAGYARGGSMNLHLKKGALHKELGVKSGAKIPAGKLAKAAHSSNPLLKKRAVFAENAKHWNHKAKGGLMRSSEHDESSDSEAYEAARGGPIKRAMGGATPRHRYGKRPPMVSPLAAAAPAAPMAPSMGAPMARPPMAGLKHGGRSRK